METPPDEADGGTPSGTASAASMIAALVRNSASLQATLQAARQGIPASRANDVPTGGEGGGSSSNGAGAGSGAGGVGVWGSGGSGGAVGDGSSGHCAGGGTACSPATALMDALKQANMLPGCGAGGDGSAPQPGHSMPSPGAMGGAMGQMACPPQQMQMQMMQLRQMQQQQQQQKQQQQQQAIQKLTGPIPSAAKPGLPKSGGPAPSRPGAKLPGLNNGSHSPAARHHPKLGIISGAAPDSGDED